MYAVIETGGKQYRVQEGDVLTIEKLNVGAGEKVEFDKVLVLAKEGDLKVGAPYVEGAKVAEKDNAFYPKLLYTNAYTQKTNFGRTQDGQYQFNEP